MKGFARRLTVVPTLFLAFSLALSACQRPQDLLGQIKSKGVVRVSTDPNYAPQSFVNAGGEFDGFDVDTAKEIARRLGVKLRLVTPEWDAIVAGNWRGQWDLSVGSMTITPERQQFLLFSPPYYYTPAQFAARADLANAIPTADDFSGRLVCTGVETTYEKYLKGSLTLVGESIQKQVSGAKIITLSTESECIQAMQAGNTDIEGVLSAVTVIDDGIKSGAPIVKVSRPVFYEALAVAVDKSAPNSEGLVAAVSKIIEDMHKDGTLTKLSIKWYGVDLTIKQ